MTKKDNTTLRTFFKHLFDPGDCVALSLLPVKGGKGKARETVLGLDDFLARLTPDAFDDWKGEDVYACFTPNPQKPGGRRSELNTETLNAVFLDFDGAPAHPFALEHAHFILSRDATHAHVYFLLDRLPATKANREAVRALSERLIAFTGADAAVKDPARVLRIPYADHVKNGVESPGYKIRAHNKKTRYTLAALDELITDAQTEPTPAKPGEASNRLEYLYELYTRRGVQAAGTGRSRFLFFLGLDCHGWGIPEDAAHLLGARVNDTLCDPPEDEAVVRHQIESAYKYRKAPFGDFLLASDDKEKKAKLERFEEVARVRDMLIDWVFVSSADRFVNTETMFELSGKESINLHVAHLCGTRLAFRELIREHAIEVVDKFDFAPDVSARIYDDAGVSVLNRFLRISHPDTTDETAERIFLDHLRYLTTSETEFTTLLHFFAFCVQNPGRKVRWAPLHISPTQGQGRSALYVLFQKIFGRYCGQVRNSELTSDNTGYLADKLLLFTQELSQGDRREVVNTLKDLITEDRVRVVEKYARTYETRNAANFVFFSNHSDAIYAEQSDRRFFVVYNDKEPRDRVYYEKLYATFTGDYAAIYNYLLAVDLSAFRPDDRPPSTAGKDLVLSHSKSELELYLDEQRAAKSGEFAYEVVSARKILSDVETYGPVIIRNRASSKAVQNYLRAHGFRPYSVNVKEEGDRTKRSVWFAGAEKGLKAALERREAVEAEAEA